MAVKSISQTQLQDFAECAYRYLLLHVRRLDNPTTQADQLGDYERALQQGTTIHRMVEQSLRGMSPDSVARHVSDPKVLQWWKRYLGEGLIDLPNNRFPELTLVAPIAGALLTARIDLLAAEPGRVVIVDWKTSEKPKLASLEARIQTRVYQWVVSQAAEGVLGFAVSPQDIEMRYWYGGDSTPRASISYSQLQQDKDEAFLRALIDRINQETAFDRTVDISRCRYCKFRSICRPMLVPGHPDAEGDLRELDEEAMPVDLSQ